MPSLSQLQELVRSQMRTEGVSVLIARIKAGEAFAATVQRNEDKEAIADEAFDVLQKMTRQTVERLGNYFDPDYLREFASIENKDLDDAVGNRFVLAWRVEQASENRTNWLRRLLKLAEEDAPSTPWLYKRWSN